MIFYFKFADFFFLIFHTNDSTKYDKVLREHLQFYEIFPDRGDYGGLFFFGEGRGVDFLFVSILVLKISFKVSHHCMLNINPRNLENGASHKKP